MTPSFNHGSFVERTIRSVLTRSIRAWSTSCRTAGHATGHPTILNLYRHRLHHAASFRDRGQTNALNLGFAHTSGEIMAYLNSDDLLLPGSLGYVARYFQNHPDVDLVYGHRIFVDSTNEEIGRWVLPRNWTRFWYGRIMCPRKPCSGAGGSGIAPVPDSTNRSVSPWTGISCFVFANAERRWSGFRASSARSACTTSRNLKPS